MKLVASLIVRNELGRYLESCVDSLLEFCDSVVIFDDASSDGTLAWLADQDQNRVHYTGVDSQVFFEHEGDARNRLFQFTLCYAPTHILAIDADEFITDGPALRATIEQEQQVAVWLLQMEEVWNASEDSLSIRIDGGWKPSSIPCLYRLPDEKILRTQSSQWRIMDRELACGREPMAVRRQAKMQPSGASILHFGWTNKSQRDDRYQRYVEHDGGNFHARRHLDSIMFPDDKIVLQHREWPVGLLERKDSILSSVERNSNAQIGQETSHA